MRHSAVGARRVWHACNGRFSQAIDERIVGAMDYGFLGRDTDADLATILVLVQRPHGAVGACQVLRKGPKPYAIDCALAYLDSWGLAEVLLKADNEPAIQALVDGVRAKRGERTMVEKSPKYSHQSNGAAENAVRRIESLTRTCVCVLQKKRSATRLTARASCCHGSCDMRRMCSVDSSSETTVAVRGPG